MNQTKIQPGKLEIFYRWVAVGFLVVTLIGAGYYRYFVYRDNPYVEDELYVQSESMVETMEEDYNTMHAGVVNDMEVDSAGKGKPEGMQSKPIWISAMYGSYEMKDIGTQCTLSLSGEDGFYKIMAQSIIVNKLGDRDTLYFECENGEIIGDCLVFKNFVDGRRVVVIPDINGDIMVLQTQGDYLYMDGVYQKQVKQ